MTFNPNFYSRNFPESKKNYPDWEVAAHLEVIPFIKNNIESPQKQYLIDLIKSIYESEI